MSAFHNTILKAIGVYKELLKKTIGRAECTTRIRQLGIKRSNIKTASELQLYQVGLNIAAELKKDTLNQKLPYTYHGTIEFLHHLETLLSNYQLQSDKIINTKQNIASALLSAIQLLATTKTSALDKATIQQLEYYSNLVLTYGTDWQKKVLRNTIHNHMNATLG